MSVILEIYYMVLVFSLACYLFFIHTSYNKIRIVFLFLLWSAFSELLSLLDIQIEGSNLNVYIINVCGESIITSLFLFYSLKSRRVGYVALLMSLLLIICAVVYMKVADYDPMKVLQVLVVVHATVSLVLISYLWLEMSENNNTMELRDFKYVLGFTGITGYYLLSDLMIWILYDFFSILEGGYSAIPDAVILISNIVSLILLVILLFQYKKGERRGLILPVVT